MSVIDMWTPFLLKKDLAIDSAIEAMAADIERTSKQVVPVNKGYLRSRGGHTRDGLHRFIIFYIAPYAAYQEFGQRADGSHQVRNYTTGGTGKFYLQGSAKKIVDQAPVYFKSANKAYDI